MSQSDEPSSGARGGDHPIDRLIRQLADDPHAVPTDEQLRQIARHVASAPFNPQFADMPPVVEAEYLGRPIGARGPSLFQHLIKRVLYDEQWAFGTTEKQLLDDFRRAATAPTARIGLRTRGPTYIVMIHTPTADVIPVERLGPGIGPNLLGSYSANRGITVTGYMVNDTNLGRQTRGVRWLT